LIITAVSYTGDFPLATAYTLRYILKNEGHYNKIGHRKRAETDTCQ